jgi:hypothetical protein
MDFDGTAVLAQLSQMHCLATPDLSCFETQCEWACVWLNLLQSENTRVDPEFGAKLVAKLMLNLRITLMRSIARDIIDRSG